MILVGVFVVVGCVCLLAVGFRGAADPRHRVGVRPAQQRAQGRAR